MVNFFIPICLKEVSIKGLVIAATKSGSGKTTVTLGLLAALAKRGLKVAPFKVGPDFIDPGHHSAITGATSTNLDGWMLSQQYNMDAFARRSRGREIAVVEGVMGLFDGYDGRSEAGSTAQMAKWLGLPVLLVVDAGSMARSAAALVQGFERFDRELAYAGVVFNNIGSPRHMAYLTDAMADHVAMPCLGGIIRNDRIRMPERHLGLVTREDHALSGSQVAHLAEVIEKSVELDRLLSLLPDITVSPPPRRPVAASDTQQKVRIGVARDNAFCFYYPDNFEILSAAGAELIEFSPISDPDLPGELDGLYLGGGYPELFADQLARNERMRTRIREKSRQGMPIYAECGGFMYLCRKIGDTRGKVFPMAGCFPFDTRMQPRLRSLGYRQVTLRQPTIIGPAGLAARGHEFHYSTIDSPTAPASTDRAFTVSARAGDSQPAAGYRVNRTLGSYIHLHFGSCPEAASHFIGHCRDYRKERKSEQ